MSAFEDYCIVCEKACDDGSAYCSQQCKETDQMNNNSPTLSVTSNGLASINGSFTLENTKSHSNSISSASCHHNHCNNNCAVPKLLSPLLTPQISTSVVNVSNLKSPTLTYESPLLISTNMNSNTNFLSDLDSNRLDLNSSNIQNPISISQRLNKTLKKQHPIPQQTQQKENSSNVTDVSNMLRSSSENYKKWLSIH